MRLVSLVIGVFITTGLPASAQSSSNPVPSGWEYDCAEMTTARRSSPDSDIMGLVVTLVAATKTYQWRGQSIRVRAGLTGTYGAQRTPVRHVEDQPTGPKVHLHALDSYVIAQVEPPQRSRGDLLGRGASPESDDDILGGICGGFGHCEIGADWSTGDLFFGGEMYPTSGPLRPRGLRSGGGHSITLVTRDRRYDHLIAFDDSTLFADVYKACPILAVERNR